MTAVEIANRILEMDSSAAQLRLVHISPLREGEYDAERLRLIVAHLRHVAELSNAILPHAEALTPTITDKTPATTPEKEV